MSNEKVKVSDIIIIYYCDGLCLYLSCSCFIPYLVSHCWRIRSSRNSRCNCSKCSISSCSITYGRIYLSWYTGLPIQSNPIDNPIQSIHIWTIENPRLDYRLLGSQSNRNSQSIISSMFFDCFGLFFGLFLDCF